jgi:hypothetical protein
MVFPFRCRNPGWPYPYGCNADPKQLHSSVSRMWHLDGFRQMSADELTARLNLVQEAIRTGNATIVLGPNTAHNGINLSGTGIPSIDAVIDHMCRTESISIANTSNISHDDVVDYCTRTETVRLNLEQDLKDLFAVKQPSQALSALTGLVWHRIYTFDISNALEVAYARNHARSQTPRSFYFPIPLP